MCSHPTSVVIVRSRRLSDRVASCPYCPILISLSKPYSSPPGITLPPHTPRARSQATRRNRHNIAHAILIPLIAILFPLVGALEAVVPCCDAGDESIVRWPIVLLRNDFVVALDREVVRRSHDAERSNGKYRPTSGAQSPREVEVPSLPEAVVVVEEVCLVVLASPSQRKRRV
jgi:hypothetical protein